MSDERESGLISSVLNESNGVGVDWAGYVTVVRTGVGCLWGRNAGAIWPMSAWLSLIRPLGTSPSTMVPRTLSSL